MKIQKKYIELMFNVLSGCEELSLKEARIRDGMRTQLIAPLKQFYQDRTKIYEKFGEKEDPKGSKFLITAENQQPLVDELEIFVNEEIDFEPAKELKDFIERTNYKPHAGETELIDAFIALL